MAAPEWTVGTLKREMWRALNGPLSKGLRARLIKAPDVVGFCQFDKDGNHTIFVDSVWTDRGIGRVAVHELIHAAMENWLCKHFSRDLNEAIVLGFESHIYDRIVSSPRERIRWGRRIAERLSEEHDEREDA